MFFFFSFSNRHQQSLAFFVTNGAFLCLCFNIASSNFHTIPININHAVATTPVCDSSLFVSTVCVCVGVCGVVVFSILIKKGMQYRTLPPFCFWFNFHSWCFFSLLCRLTFHNAHTHTVSRYQFYQWKKTRFGCFVFYVFKTITEQPVNQLCYLNFR